MLRDTHSLRLAVRCMLTATRTILLQFHATGIVTTIFLGRVIALFTFGARQGNYRADIFLRCHNLLNL